MSTESTPAGSPGSQKPQRFAGVQAFLKSPRMAAMMQSPRKRAMVLAAVGVAATGLSVGLGLFVLLAVGKFSDPENPSGVEGSSEGASAEAGGGSSSEGAASEGEAAAEGASGEHGGTGKAAKGAPNKGLHDLGPFTINLRGSNGARVLRIQLWVQPVEPFAAEVANATTQLRSVAVLLVGDYSYHDLEGTEGKVRLRDELLAKMNQTLGRHMIDRIYFTEFVVQ